MDEPRTAELAALTKTIRMQLWERFGAWSEVDPVIVALDAIDRVASRPAVRDGLDVERLETAVHNVTNIEHWSIRDDRGVWIGRPRVVAAIAREYAALADKGSREAGE